MCYVDAAGVTMVQRCPPPTSGCSTATTTTTSAPARPPAATWRPTGTWPAAPSWPPPTRGPPPPTTTRHRPRPPCPRPQPPSRHDDHHDHDHRAARRPRPPCRRPPRPCRPRRPRPSRPTTTTTVAPGTPSAPRNLVASTASYFGQGVRLTWTAPVTGPVTGYNVYRRTGTGAFVKVADLAADDGLERHRHRGRPDLHLRRLGRERHPGRAAVEPVDGHGQVAGARPSERRRGRPPRPCDSGGGRRLA